MQVEIKNAPKPQSVLWEDLNIGEGAQSVEKPGNILLKTGDDAGLRIQQYNGYPAMTIQHPGAHSEWFRCDVNLTFQPVVRAI